DPDRPVEDGLRHALIRVRHTVGAAVAIDPDADAAPGLADIEASEQVRLFRRHGGMHRTPVRHDHTLVRAYSLFLTPWLHREPDAFNALTSFDLFLMGLAAASTDAAPLYPDALPALLDDAHDAMAGPGGGRK